MPTSQLQLVIMILASLGALLLVLWGVLPLFLRRRTQTRMRYYLLTVPHYSSDERESENAEENVKTLLSDIEAFFAALASVRAQRGLKPHLYGRDDHFVLEIIAHRGTIRFYAAVPEALDGFFRQQLQSVFPHVDIAEVEDFNPFSPTSVVLASRLRLKRKSFFPIKTYAEFDADPMENLLTPLSQIKEGESVAIQFVLRSAKEAWHRAGKKVAHALYEGKGMDQALSEAGANKTWLRVVEGMVKDIFSSVKKTTPEDPLQERDLPRQASELERTIAQQLEKKTSKGGFDVNIRVVSSASNESIARQNLMSTIQAFGIYNLYESGNSFRASMPVADRTLLTHFIHRTYQKKHHMILNSEEMVSLWHLPGTTVDTPNIQWLPARSAAPPSDLPQEGIFLGNNVYRGNRTAVRLLPNDRRRHMYVIGQTGTGKSELMKGMAIQDIKNGNGCGVIDPHGDLINDILQHIPEERINDVIVFDPSDTAFPLGINLLEYETEEQKTFVINELINIFDRLYDLKQTGGPMFEQYLRNSVLLMLEDTASGSTLLEIPRVLSDHVFRDYKLSHTTNPVVRNFWLKEALKAGGEASLANMVPYITSKLNQFISNDVLRPIIAQQKSTLNFREVMDGKKILLVNLSKGKLGDLNTKLLGMIFVGKILMAALGRIDTPEKDRNDFYLYIDEFQNFTTDSIAVILSEARKYRLDLVLAHQYITQLVKGTDTQIRDAVFGNVGTKVAFRIGMEDAEFVAPEYEPVFTKYDLLNIPKFNAYIKMLIHNELRPAFNLQTIAVPAGNPSIAERVRAASRKQYGRPRAYVEQEILDRSTKTYV